MNISTILFVAIPTLLVLLIVWFASKDKGHEHVESDEEDQMLMDPITGRPITMEEAEQGIQVTEEEEKKILSSIEFDEIGIESNKDSIDSSEFDDHKEFSSDNSSFDNSSDSTSTESSNDTSSSDGTSTND
jgi:hypothetical protein